MLLLLLSMIDSLQARPLTRPLTATHPPADCQAEQASFLVDKLQVRMLPCIITFQGGVAGERIVGFDRLGNRDDFGTAVLEKLLLEWGAVVAPPPVETDDDAFTTIRKGLYQRMKTKGSVDKTVSDEDSDFSD